MSSDASPTRYVIAPAATASGVLGCLFAVALFALFSAAVVYATFARAAYAPSARMFRDILLDDHAAAVAELEDFIADAVEGAPRAAREPFATLSPATLSPAPAAPADGLLDGLLDGARATAARALAAAERLLARASFRAYATGNTIRATRAPPAR
jgi:hypothetical protein